jgi:ribosome-interacting GTPase 1
MAANLPPEYYKAELEYRRLKDTKEKINCLEKMISLIPLHKGSEKHVAQLKQRISKLKKKLEREEKQKKIAKRKSFGIKKEGAAQVCLVGLPNTGKSFILNKYCGKHIESTEKQFETKTPEIGMLNCKGVKIQLIEIPSFFEGFAEKQREMMSIVKNCDLVLIIGESELVKKELEKANVKKKIIEANSNDKIDEVIWNSLDFIRVFTKPIGKEPDEEPIALKKGSTIRELAEVLHKDFLKKFKFARLWGKSVKYNAQVVGIDHVLEDGDVVEFHLK